MSEDPERLLRRLRAAPSPAFLARLKARLDEQAPTARRPSAVDALLSGLTTGRWLLRAVSRSASMRPWHMALAVLLCGLAGVFLSLPRYAPQLPSAQSDIPAGTSAAVISPPSPGGAESSSGPPSPAVVRPAPLAAASSVPHRISDSTARKRSRPATDAPPLIAHAPRPTAAGDTVVMVGGVSALASYVQDLPLRFFAEPDSQGTPAVRIEAISGVSGQGCSGVSPVVAREPQAGQGSCPPAAEPGSQKTLIGHEVAFLARSARSGALPLPARAIFLALARKVPDPSHPEILVSNPYRLWSDIDPALPPDPIRVLGPPQSSPLGAALLALILQPGCRRVLPEGPLSHCQAVRGDDVYDEVPEYESSLVSQLTAHPSWLGLLSLDLLMQGGDALAVSPVNDIAPAAATILSGAYPAARSLYLSVRTGDLRSRPVLSNLVFRYRERVEEGAVAGPHAALVSSAELQSQLPSPP